MDACVIAPARCMTRARDTTRVRSTDDARSGATRGRDASIGVDLESRVRAAARSTRTERTRPYRRLASRRTNARARAMRDAREDAVASVSRDEDVVDAVCGTTLHQSIGLCLRSRVPLSVSHDSSWLTKSKVQKGHLFGPDDRVVGDGDRARDRVERASAARRRSRRWRPSRPSRARRASNRRHRRHHARNQSSGRIGTTTTRRAPHDDGRDDARDGARDADDGNRAIGLVGVARETGRGRDDAEEGARGRWSIGNDDDEGDDDARRAREKARGDARQIRRLGPAGRRGRTHA